MPGINSSYTQSVCRMRKWDIVLTLSLHPSQIVALLLVWKFATTAVAGTSMSAISGRGSHLADARYLLRKEATDSWHTCASYRGMVVTVLPCRDGLKFGTRKSSAECLAWFGSATCDYSAEVLSNFGVIGGFAFAAFCVRRWRWLKSVYLIICWRRYCIYCSHETSAMRLGSKALYTMIKYSSLK